MCKQNPGNFWISLYQAHIHMYVAPLEWYRSGLFSTSIVSPFGMIISIKDPLILKDLTRIVYSSGSHGFLSPKISRKYIKESDMAGALKLWYRGGLGSIWFSHLHHCRQDFGSYTAHLAVAILGSQIWFSFIFLLWTYLGPGSWAMEMRMLPGFCLHILWNSLFSLSFESHETYYRSLERSWREESNGVKGEGIGPVFMENVRS